MKTGYKEFQDLLDVSGTEHLFSELVDELLENMEFIARMEDVDPGEEL